MLGTSIEYQLGEATNAIAYHCVGDMLLDESASGAAECVASEKPTYV